MAKEKKVHVNKDRDNFHSPDNNEFNLDKWAYEMVDLQEKKERVYHYTSLETLYTIISGVKDDFFTFHAGSVYTMNDSEEMKRGYDYIKKYLPLIEEELKVPKEHRLLNLTNNKDVNKNIKKNFGEWIINDDNTNFVISFSSEPDILPMWALYGNNGEGVCLEFSPYVIKKFYEQRLKEKNIQINRCVYNEEEIKVYTIGDLSIIYKMFLEGVSDEKKTDPYEKVKYLAIMCGIIGAYVKHPGFEYEKEIRMNVFRNIKYWRFHETRYGHQSAYVEVPIPIASLTNIIVGPAANMEYVNNALKLRLRTIGVKIEPIQSKIPFRLY